MINFKKILSFENNIKYCNYLISVAPLLYIVSIIFFEITVFFSSILIAYAIFKKKIFFKKDTLLILFFLFYLILLLSSLINGDTKSIIKSFVYIRFILFFLFITYFYNFNSFKLLSKTIFITLIFIYFGDELISGAYIKKYLFIGMIIILSYQKNLYVNIFIFLSVFIAFITGEKVSFILISFGVFIYSLIYLKKISIYF